jgi:D-alanyl-lipoteichoic acid acyltransferase DltB (MBOAT superfamily)
MLFNSFEFLIFFPVVTILYFLLPHKFRWFHLLVASCVFYMFFVPLYIVILFGTIVIDYYAGILIENAPEGKKRRWLIMSLAANIGVLAVFKYYNFFIDNIQQVINWMGFTVQLPLLRILLPIGLSFHTFQAMSYTLEVYYENQKAERNFGIYALYVMFYPQLVAGPVERPQNVLYQFYEKHALRYNDVAEGLRLMMWGMIKKVVIADRLGLVTTRIFDDAASQSGINVVIGYVYFTFQIYCDFSGYSDIALGTARVMGFNLMKNFNFPFRAKSVSDFYKRWHMSLSTWFSDYLHTPLTYSFRRIGLRGVALASVITFFLSGLWHGAAWQFILWGVMMGLAIAFEVLTHKQRKAFFALFPPTFGNLLAKFITFSYISFWSLFFRANSVADAFMMMRKVGNIPAEIATIVRTHKFAFLNLPNVYDYLVPGLAVICLLEGCNWLTTRYDMPKTFASRPSWLRWSAYYAGILLLMFCGVYEKHQFIYFQF